MSKILIVDDEKEICDLLKRRFNAEGLNTLTANDGDEGLQLMRSERPNVVVLDIGMPHTDGYTFVKEVQRDKAINKIPILILTAKDRMQEVFKAERIENYYLKPFDIDKLMVKVRGIVNGNT